MLPVVGLRPPLVPWEPLLRAGVTKAGGAGAPGTSVCVSPGPPSSVLGPLRLGRRGPPSGPELGTVEAVPAEPLAPLVSTRAPRCPAAPLPPTFTGKAVKGESARARALSPHPALVPSGRRAGPGLPVEGGRGTSEWAGGKARSSPAPASSPRRLKPGN